MMNHGCGWKDSERMKIERRIDEKEALGWILLGYEQVYIE
jgi:hypothetical protein